MLLLIDVGNTNITLGVSADGELTHDWRLSCRAGITNDEFWVMLSSLLAPENITVADIDGIAMSSRNQYLSAADRNSARSLSQALESAQVRIKQGERSAETIRTEIRKTIEQNNGTKVDYISVCDPENFVEQKEINSKILIALAVRVGNTRLIDNRVIERIQCNK